MANRKISVRRHPRAIKKKEYTDKKFGRVMDMVPKSRVFSELVLNNFEIEASEQELLKSFDLEKLESAILNGEFDWKTTEKYENEDLIGKISFISAMFVKVKNLLSFTELLLQLDDQSIEKLNEIMQKYKEEKERLKNIIFQLRMKQLVYVDALKHAITDDEKTRNQSEKLDSDAFFLFPDSNSVR